METVEINKQNLIKEFKKASKCGKDLLVKLHGKDTFIEPKKVKTPLTLRNKLKTLSDVLKYNKTTLVKELPFKKPKTSRQRQLNGQAIWMLIIETFNQGWVKKYPSSDSNYVPYGEYNKENGSFSYDDYDHWHTGTGVGLGLGFKEYDDMIYCTDVFNKEWNDMLLAR